MKATAICKGLQVPKGYVGPQRRIWQQVIGPCDWLTQADEIKAKMLVNLLCEYEKDSKMFSSARLSVLRSLTTDLMETARRTRVPTTRPRTRASRFFDDERTKESKYFD